MSELLRIISEEIEEQGPIRFDRFMHLALYHPDHGYYSRHSPGEPGMWRTSPTVSDGFGQLIARALHRSWELLDEPSQYTVVEPGAGRGDLARQAFASAEGSFRRALAWHIVELRPNIREHQQQALAGLPVTWSEALPEVGEGAVVANEVLDNFPARIFDFTEGSVAEVYVGFEGGRLIEVKVPSDMPWPDAAGESERFEMQDFDGIALGSWSSLTRGHLFVLDYGDTEPGIFHPFGTLVCYQGEHLDIDPLTDPGDKDITCHVNFTRLGRALAGAGWKVADLMTQRELLIALGIEELAQELKARRDDIAALAELGRLSLLYRRGALGDLKVLLGSKGCPPLSL